PRPLSGRSLMTARSWIRKLFGRKACPLTTRRPPRHRARLAVEALEDRLTPAVTFIHDVQGNGATTPIPGATVTVEGVVVGSYQGSAKLQGFFLQEEDAHADADPNTSEGIFVFTGAGLTPVAEGQRVQVTGTVSEFSGMTQITAATAGSVVVT